MVKTDLILSQLNFWLLPKEFNGNRLTSYGGFLEYSFTYLPNTAKQPKRLSVEILTVSIKRNMNHQGWRIYKALFFYRIKELLSIISMKVWI